MIHVSNSFGDQGFVYHKNDRSRNLAVLIGLFQKLDAHQVKKTQISIKLTQYSLGLCKLFTQVSMNAQEKQAKKQKQNKKDYIFTTKNVNFQFCAQFVNSYFFTQNFKPGNTKTLKIMYALHFTWVPLILSIFL